MGLMAVPGGAASQLRFEEVGTRSGVEFTLQNAPTAAKRMIETMAGGLAVFDYNGDGQADVFFANGAAPESLRKDAPRYFNRLYRNDGGFQFSDVTETAGVSGEGFSMGAAAADYDNDGDEDLFVAGVFRNILYRNDGDGTFSDVTSDSGISSAEWAVAAGWFDYNGDSRLDLFVVNYADWTLEFDRYCGDRDRELRVYCHPKYLTPIANRLYRNLGSGRFEDVTAQTGLSNYKGRGMSAAFVDFDGDGRQEIFVTNDNLPNFLFVNQSDNTFYEDALLAGVALLDHGRPVASMGVDVGDVDGDGVADIAVTALSNETYPLFRGDGTGTFQDVTVTSGLAKASRLYAGWGNILGDFDLDGRLDLFTANSHVNDLVEHFEPFAYRQPNTVFRNLGGTFGAPQQVGGARAHRGAMAEDFDGDGLLDLVVTALGEPAGLFRNISVRQGNWVELELVGEKSNRDALGARVRVGTQTRWVKGALGYASSRIGPVHFGLGAEEGPLEITIDWPSGARQTARGVPTNRRTTIKERADSEPR